MRCAMASDVAAERRLDVIKDLLEVLPRSPVGVPGER